MTQKKETLPTHDEMLQACRSLVVLSCEHAASSRDVAAIAGLVTAYNGAVDGRPSAPGPGPAGS